MFICNKCGLSFETPAISYITHGLDTPPYESVVRCSSCLSTDIEFKAKSYCGFCGLEIKEGEKYCNSYCEKMGEEYFRREEERRKQIAEFDVSKAIAEVEEYNRTHGTNYSYGRYFALKGLGELDDRK